LRKFILLAAGVLLSAGTLAACIGGPPPPPPTDPHDVLVVGDSVAFSFGCALGDPGEINGVPPGSCPSQPDYSVRNDWTGACTITPGTLSLYNGSQASAPNCDTQPAGSRNQTWADDAGFFVPKVVIINTAGWEIQDRYLSFTQPPDGQWGTNNQFFNNIAVQYTNQLFNAINTFRNSPRDPVVLIANAPYIDPPEPLPPPGSVPAGVECSWWEPNDPTAPISAGPDCTGDAQAGSGGQWRSPTGNTTYRSSHAKLDQVNQMIQQVKDNYFGSDNKVQVFNFKKHFNGTNNDYNNYICPPPHDFDTPAVNQIDVRPGPTFGQMVYLCDDGSHVPTNYVNAILARAPDQGHLSPAGTTDILGLYLNQCVRSKLGISGGVPASCT
jgi:hypothetical protein